MKHKFYRRKICKWTGITIISIIAFFPLRYFGTMERDSNALGGEVLILLLPTIYYAISKTVQDWIINFKKTEESEHE